MCTENRFVELYNVSFSYGNQLILNQINLSLMKGISYALIGKSGVGKSTLLNLIAGFAEPAEGSIVIDKQKIQRPRKNTAFLFQDLGLFPWQTVTQAVMMPLTLAASQDTEKNREVVIKLLREMELEYIKDKYPGNLSGGEKQRVALARTMIGDPDLILMDEPTSSLDSMTKEIIQKLVLKYLKKQKATMLFITHDIEEAVLLGEKILLLNPDGSISTLDNPFYGIQDAKEQLGFYDTCIQIRKLVRVENE